MEITMLRALLLVVLLCPVALADCLVQWQIVGKDSPYRYPLGIGDRVALVIPGGGNTPATFLGVWNESRPAQSHYVFAPADGGPLIFVPPTLVKQEGAQEFRVGCQSGPTCAADAAFTGIAQLNELGQLPPKLAAELKSDPKALLDKLRESPMTRDVFYRQYGDGALYNPREARRDWLRGEGIDARVRTWRISKVKSHIRSGKPAILDLDVGLAEEKVSVVQPDGSRREVTRQALVPYFGQPKVKRADEHSVVAVGLVTIQGEEKVIVLDTSLGAAHLWSWKEVQQSLTAGTTLGH